MSGLVLHAPAPASVRLIECSPPSWMVELCMREKQLDYAVDVLDFAKGEHRSPAMLARNPRGTVPVLSDGEAHVYETFAILEYLEWAYPEPPLLPTGAVARARALSRLHESEALKSAGMAAFAYLMRNPDPDPATLAGLRGTLLEEIGRWEQRLGDGGGPWISGERLGLADLSVFTYLATAEHLGLELASFPALDEFVRRMRARPSVRATWPALWQDDRYRWLTASS
ncbi:MAG: glutathione S-transferase family protein [Myxococcales bacterium]|nr:glutathione S-transferase family protein [Myxococcales bacterium]